MLFRTSSSSFFRQFDFLFDCARTLPQVRLCSSNVGKQEIEMLRTSLNKFIRNEVMPNTAHYDKTGEFPWEAVKKAHELGVMNTEIPTELGGVRFPVHWRVQLFEEIAYGDSSIGTSLMVNDLAQIPLIMAGSDSLKQKYLKRLLEKPLLASYAVTEPNAGSDLSALETKAEAKGDKFVLNGSKIWITNAGIADWYFILARTNFNSDCSPSKAFTGFIVDRDTKGLEPGVKEDNMGQRCSDTRQLTLIDVAVPRENVVGNVGDGFPLAMRAFDRIRPIVASMACGITQRALDESAFYALQRKTFGVKIADYQSISFKLADMAINLEAARELTRKSAQMVDEENDSSTYFSSCAKVLASDIAFQAASEAVQIYGGNGINSEFPVEKLLRDSKILQIYGGTNEIQRMIISKKLIETYSSKLDSM